MTSHQAVKSYKKSSIPGVNIAQFVDRIPEGCSTPDFERKPVTLTLQEGKNAIFRAVVKGVPTPEVKWRRAKGEMDNPDKYEIFFSEVTNEYVLKINKLTADDTDVYRCFAINEYGEATCSAGLRIIQVGFKRKAQHVPAQSADELKKKLQDLRKLLRKRAPAPKQKTIDKEAIFQLLLHADKRDYEKICIKYGISDFRGMLRKLQEMRRDAESEQGELIHSIKNMEHIKVNKDGTATFSLAMDLKNSNSKIYLLKDGERLRYGTGDEYRKHYLRRIGKRYNFIVNDVQPEDAGVYQVRVEDVPVFSTELDAESIPVRFQQPLRDVRCPEKGNAVFECTLRSPCYDAVWLHKTHPLEASEKHQISITPDGLTHQLVIKDVEASDNGMYILDTGLCSSNAYLLVEYPKGKKRQDEEGEKEKSGWRKETLTDKDGAKKPKCREHLSDKDHLMDAGIEKDDWYRNGQEGSQGYSADVDEGRIFLGKEGLRKTYRDGTMGPGQFSEAERDGESMTDDDSNIRLQILGGKKGLRPVHSQDSMTGRANTGDRTGGADELYSVDGRDEGMLDAVDVDMDDAEGMDSWHGKNDKVGDNSSRAGFGGIKKLGATDGSSVLDGLDPASTRVGDKHSLYGKDDMLGRTRSGKNAAGTETAGGMRSSYSKDGLPTVAGVNGAGIKREGETGALYGKDGSPVDAGGHLGQTGRSGLLYGPGGLPAGDGATTSAGGSSAGEMGVLYGPDGLPVGASVDNATAGKMGGFYGKHGQSGEPGAGAGNWVRADGAGRQMGSPYQKDGLPDGTGAGGAGVGGFGGVGSTYGKDGLPMGLGTGAGIGGTGVDGFGGVGSPYGRDGLPAGAGVGGAGAGGIGSPYGKDGLPVGMGPGASGTGVDGFGGVGSPYGKDGLPAGLGIGGAGGIGSPYGKDGLPVGMGTGAGVGGVDVGGLGGAGYPYGKDGLPAGAAVGGSGLAGAGGVGSPYGKDGLPAGAGVGGADIGGFGGAGSPYGKDGLPAGAGTIAGGAGVGGLGGVGSPYGKDGLPVGMGPGAGGAGAGGDGSPYAKDGLPAGAGVGGVGVGGLGGVGSPYGKDGLPDGAGVVGAGVGGAGGIGSPYGKDGLPVGMGTGAGVGGAGLGGLGGVGSPYGKDGLPAGVGGAGAGGAAGIGAPYGKDGLPAGAGFGGAGAGGLGGAGSPYGKHGLPAGVGGAGAGGLGGLGSPYGKDGLPAGAGVGGAGAGGLGGVGSPYGKDGLPAGVGGAGAGGLGGLGSPYGKDGLPAGAGVGGADGLGGLGSPYGKDGLPAGAGVGGAGAGGLGGVGSPYGKDGLPAGAGAGIGGAGAAGLGGIGSPYGKDGLPAGAGSGDAGAGGLGGLGSPYGKDGLPAGAGVGGADGLGGLGSPYGKDGLPAGAGVGVGGAGAGGLGGVGSPYGKDGLPAGAGAGIGGAGAAGLGGIGSPYGKDGLPAGAGAGGAGAGGLGGVGSPYGKDGLPAGVGVGGAGAAGLGGVGSPYGKDGLPAGAGAGGAGAGGLGSVGSPYEKDGLPAGVGVGGAGAGGLGGVGSPYGKDGLPAGVGVGGAGAAGLGGVGSPYGKDGLPAGAGAGGAGAGGLGGVGSPYGKDGLPAGAGAGGAGAGGLGGVGSPYGKDGLPAGVGVGGAGAAGLGGVGSPYGKDGLPAGAGAGGAGAGGLGGVGSPYGKDGLPAGVGVGGAGAGGLGGVGSPYGKDGLPAGVGVGGAGAAGLGGVGSPYGKDVLPAGVGAGVGIGGLGGVGSPYGKDGLSAGVSVGGAGAGGLGGVGSPYGKDGLPAGAGIGGAGLGSMGGLGSPYGKDGLSAGVGAGVGGAGVGGLGGVGSPYGKDGLPVGMGIGASVGGAGAGGFGGVGSPYGKDGLPAGAGGSITSAKGAGSSYGKDGLSSGAAAGVARSPFGGEEVMGSHHGRGAGLSSVQGYGGGAGGAGLSSEGRGVGGSAILGAGSAYGKDGGSAGGRAGGGGVGRLGGDGKELHSAWGTEGMAGGVGMGGEYGLDSRPGKSAQGEAGKGTAGDFRGPGHKGSPHDKESGQRDGRGEDRDLGQLGSRYGKDSVVGGAAGKSHDRLGDRRKPGVFGQGSPGYDQTSNLYGGPSSINQRKQLPSLDIKTNDFLKNTESTEKRRHYRLDDLRAPRCHVNKQLIDVRVQKGEPAELSCAVNKEDLTGTWFKDGLKLTSMDGVVFEKQGLVHKLIFSKVEDIHAGKYRFEAGDIKTEALIFVEDPPQVDRVLLKNLTSVPTVAKAGENIKIKIPFEGRLPVRATWLKDKMELADDSRIRLDKTDTYTMLSISNTERKDRGDYKVRLKNDSGILDIDLKVEVTDKPQPPAGPLKILESSANDITIQWKPPKDDGGKPVQSYIVERQEVGKGDWMALAETPRSCTTFTTNKVERDMSYYFRVRAVNAEGTSDALESEEVKAVSKATPGAPDPPEIISVSKDTITISWKTPRRTGSSRIVGYIVQKRKKGTITWVPVNSVPIADKKLKMTNLKKGLQYEFCVAAVNASGVGDISAPSQPVFARDSTKPPGQVRDLTVTSTDSTSVTLTWKRPEAKDGNDVKGYDVEIRSSNNLDWTKCNVLPIEVTTYTVKGLQNKELYFLRVRALNDCGQGEAAELEAFIEADSTVVSPRFLIDDTVKNFLIIKAGNTIRVDIPFEASPDPEVTWLKDGLLLSNRATISTKGGTSQLLIKAAELTDSGTYTIELKNGSGKRETFSFQVQVTDIPQNPGPILLQENVPNAVTVTWEPSASEKWESNLYYTVLKRESQKGVWHVVGDLIYTNKFTYTKVIPGRDYYFRVVAKNELGSSGPSETVQPWRIKKTKAEVHIRPQKYRGVNQNQPPRFLVPLKPHVVTTGSECRMSCAVAGHPPPKITWYKDSRDLSSDPAYFGTNDFGVCSLVIQGVSKADEGEYMVEAANELGRVFSRAFLTIKDSSL